MNITSDQILQAYAAAHSLPEGTPIFLDGDGDIAHPEKPEFPEHVPDDCLYLCTADHSAFLMPHFSIHTDPQDNVWRVSGYGNEFNDRSEAMQFALNNLGADGEVFEDFAEYIAHSIQQSYMAA
jgi:hypothetical protein